MFRYLFLLLLALTVAGKSLLAQDTIPNHSFEHWNTNYSLQDWQTTNQFLPPGLFTCSKTNNSYEGDFALQMKTIEFGGSGIPAVATLGILGLGYTEGGVPFNSKPSALKAAVRHPSSGDQVMIVAQFFKNGIEIGSGAWISTDSIPDFTEISTPIYYVAPGIPDTLLITILTDQFQPGSSMTIDALGFDYPATSVFEKKINPLKIYPNPCRDFVSVDASQEEYRLLHVLDETGNSKSLETAGNKLLMNALTPGIYYLIFELDGTLITRKVIKI